VDTKCRICWLPIAGVDKGDEIHRLDLRFSCAQLSRLLFLAIEHSASSSKLHPPPPMAMASGLPTSHYQSENDLRAMRKAIGWQFPGYDSKMRCGILEHLILLSIRPGWARAVALQLLPRVARALCASASTPITTLHHASGDLCPLV
jgi:hypothetical protein